MTDTKLTTEQCIQEEQYAYPYHYIPQQDSNTFSQTHHWSWGFRYLGGLRVVIDILQGIAFESLVDIGCGDGRFLREVASAYPGVDLLGIDYSRRAVELASAMNPGLHYERHDLLDSPLPRQFDVASLIEVLEHIRPDQVGSFIEAAGKTIKDDGHLILTVPHTNKRITTKHFQHFTSEGLRGLLSDRFTDLTFIPFDTKSVLLEALLLLLGGHGKHYVITNARLIGWFNNLYQRRFLYTGEEARCLRIAAVGRKKPRPG